MEDRQKKVVDEKEELDNKITKLQAFLTTETFKKVDTEHQELLKEQLVAMEKYSVILGKRIYLFKSKKGLVNGDNKIIEGQARRSLYS